MNIDPRLESIIAAQPYPLVFATISGAHLYGFPSPDSDYDLRGVHLLPLENVLSLDVRDETLQDSRLFGGLEMDIVSHDARKFFRMLLKKNGYVLEQLLSPLIVQTTPEHEELKAIARSCITRHHSHHYLGFAETQWRLFSKEQQPRVKPLLYTYRVLLTGIHLMRSGEIEANLLTLNEEFQLSFLAELVEQKLSGPEKSSFNGANISFHEAEVNRLRHTLEVAHVTSTLPELPSSETRERLSELLVRLRVNPPVKTANEFDYFALVISHCGRAFLISIRSALRIWIARKLLPRYQQTQSKSRLINQPKSYAALREMPYLVATQDGFSHYRPRHHLRVFISPHLGPKVIRLWQDYRAILQKLLIIPS